jgi:hypothetical protein
LAFPVPEATVWTIDIAGVSGAADGAGTGGAIVVPTGTWFDRFWSPAG